MTASSIPGGSLVGIRVIDLTRVLAGPFCTMILGDLGAEIIKVEEPKTGDVSRILPPEVEGRSPYFTAANRNKRSIAVNLKAPDGLRVVEDLIASADVVVENFRPGVLDRLGLGWEALRRLRPNILLCSISGFGSDSSLADEPSFDLTTQALSGVMSINGEPDGPPTRLGLPLGDLAGGLWAAIAILAALQQRTRTGEGQHLEVALLDGLMALLGYHATLSMGSGEDPERISRSGHHGVVPYGCYPTSDGYLTVAVYGDQFWPGFCRAVGRPEWVDDQRFATMAARRANRSTLDLELGALFGTRTRDEWVTALRDHNVPNAPVLGIGEALTHPYAEARELLIGFGELWPGTVVRNPIRFSSHSQPPTAAPPRLGQNTAEILTDILGYDWSDVERLRESGAIRLEDR